MTTSTNQITLGSASWTLIGVGPLDVAVQIDNFSSPILLREQDGQPALGAPAHAQIGNYNAVAQIRSGAQVWGLVVMTGQTATVDVTTGIELAPAAALTTNDGGAAVTGAAMPAGGVGLTGWLSAIWAKLSGTLTVSDSQSAPFAGNVAMTVGTSYPAQRSLGVLATVAGNVQFQCADASSLTLPVAVGWNTFPFAVTQIVGAGTTATATFYNLK